MTNKSKPHPFFQENERRMKTYCKLLYAFPLLAALFAHSACQANNHLKVNTTTITQLDINR